MKRGKGLLSMVLCVGIILGSIGSYTIVSNANGAEDSAYDNNIQMSINNENKTFITEGKDNEIKISIMNDFHFFSKSLYSDCDEFNYDCKAEKKLLLESEAILNKAFEKIKEEKPDVILVGGDMSKDGEKVNHEYVASKLKLLKEELAQEGVNTQIYVTNGNHDINGNARDYSSGKTVHIPSVTPTEYKEIYKDFGYGEGSEFYTTEENVGGGLSYAVDMNNGYTLIVVDTCKYTPDQITLGNSKAQTGGMISDDLLNWVVTKAKEAYDEGNIPLVLQHHSIIEHYTNQRTLGKNFVLDDFEKINKAYADAGIKIVFSGHTHANDIAMEESEDGKKVYDVVTSSLTGYPLSTRNVYVATEENKLYFDTEVDFLKEIDYIDESTGKKIENLEQYVLDKCMGDDAIRVMCSEYTVELALKKIRQQGGIKGKLAKILKTSESEVVDELVRIAKEKLPKDEKNAITFSAAKMNFSLFYNEKLNAIYLKQNTGNDVSKLAVELYIPMDELKDFVEKLCSDIDNNVINDTKAVNNVVQKAVDKLMSYKFYKCKTPADYYRYIYHFHKTGYNDGIEDIEDEYLKPLLSGTKSMKKLIKDGIYKSTKKEAVKLLSKNKLDVGSIIKAGNNNITTKAVVKLAVSSFDDMGDIWTKIGKRVILSKPVINYANEFGLEVVAGIAIDENIKEDNDLSCVISLN